MLNRFSSSHYTHYYSVIIVAFSIILFKPDASACGFPVIIKDSNSGEEVTITPHSLTLGLNECFAYNDCNDDMLLLEQSKIIYFDKSAFCSEADHLLITSKYQEQRVKSLRLALLLAGLSIITFLAIRLWRRASR